MEVEVEVEVTLRLTVNQSTCLGVGHPFEELHDLYSSPSIIRKIKSRMRWARHVARMGEKRSAYRLLVGKPEERRPLERSRRRWLDNIRMDFVEVVWGDVD
jgi:hypothetical protein